MNSPSEIEDPKLEENFAILFEQEFAQSNEDYFSDLGHRRLALDMLIDSVTTVKGNQNSKAAVHEKKWLLGISDNCPIPASMCFDAISSGDVDSKTAALKFCNALSTDSALLLKSLQQARVKLINGEFDFEIGDLVEYKMPSQNIERQRNSI